MTTTVLSPYLTSQFFGNNGQFLAGGTISTFQGGTNTPIATFTDVTGTVQNTNPIVLNSRGECSIWLLPNTSYKFVLQDSNGNTIWTRDQVTEAQLLTLFGGIDSGAANNYLLNFAAVFSTYQNGIVIYWIPSNNNTGPSTLNVNGLGVIPITNINGSPLGANQIVAGQTVEVMFFNGAFQLLSTGSIGGVTIGTFGQEVPIASAATTDLGLAPNHVVLITGSATISSFGSNASIQAPIYHCRVAAGLQINFNATSMILPGNTNLAVNAGDAFLAQYLGTGNWKMTIFQSSTGTAASSLSKIKPADTAVTSDATVNPDPDLVSGTLAVGRYQWAIYLIFDSGTGTAGFKWTNGGTAVDSRGVAPAVASGFVNAAAYGPKNESPYGTTITYATVGTATDSNNVLYTGSLLVATPGTFGVSWSQGTSTATPTTLRSGSYLTLNLLTTGSNPQGVVHTYASSGAFVDTVPAGQTTLTIEVWGASGGGGTGLQGGGSNACGGGGGASGGYVRSVVNVTGLAGDTLNISIGASGNPSSAGGNSTITSGTLAITTMTAGGGGGGTNAVSLIQAGNGGTPGTATGGTTVNTPGNAGQAGLNNNNGGFGGVGGGPGGFGIVGLTNGGSKGGNGSGTNFAGLFGAAGLAVLTYSP